MWAFFAFQEREEETAANANALITPAKRRGALIFLTMVARVDKAMVKEKLDLLVNIGLGILGQRDSIVAKYTCMCLQRLSGLSSMKKGKLPHILP